MDCDGLLLIAMDCVGLPWTGMDRVQWAARGCDCLPVPITIPITTAVVVFDSHGLPRRGMDCID